MAVPKNWTVDENRTYIAQSGQELGDYIGQQRSPICPGSHIYGLTGLSRILKTCVSGSSSPPEYFKFPQPAEEIVPLLIAAMIVSH